MQAIESRQHAWKRVIVVVKLPENKVVPDLEVELVSEEDLLLLCENRVGAQGACSMHRRCAEDQACVAIAFQVEGGVDAFAAVLQLHKSKELREA